MAVSGWDEPRDPAPVGCNCGHEDWEHRDPDTDEWGVGPCDECACREFVEWDGLP
jgi:hypothetical protein